MAIIFGLIILSSTAWAQVLPCPSNFQNPPSVSQLSHSRTNDIIIPVVFHVVELDGLQLFSDAEIAQLMLVLNDDFELTSEERKSVITSVNGTPGSVGFHFALAEVDPSGAATSGILRIATDITNIGDKISGDGILVMKSSEMGGSDPWDVTNYVNVWIGERNISLGATVAANDDRSDIEGIIIGNRAMLESPKTISHEMGHYFGLLHPWGNFIGCDDEDDGIEDTPFQAAPNFYCQSILNCNTYTKPGNIMDFTADECLEYFTRMQATAMQQFAVTHKSKLIASSDCFEENLPLDRDFITINTIVGSVEIYFDTSDKYESVMLFDLQGRLISLHPSKGQSFLNISTEGICPGIYVLQIIRADKRFARKIFTK